MTHDDVLSALQPRLARHTDDLTTFELQNYTPVGLFDLHRHETKLHIAKPGWPDPETSPFVRHVMAAIDAVRPDPEE